MRTLYCTQSQIGQGPLILVNKSHGLQSDFRPQLVNWDPKHRHILMERRAAQLLQSCIHAVGGIQEIVPVSGWRSQQEQEAIWQSTWERYGEAFTRQYVAPPGCSEHQSGLAIDLGRAAKYIDFIRPAFPYDGVCGAFRKVATDYGFIQRYEKGKESVTEISCEPWHFRYVGAPHAQLITMHHLALEEYSSFLQEKPRICQLQNGRMAQVFYVPASGEKTPIEIPDGCYQISGDNVAGFIVTLWGQAI